VRHCALSVGPPAVPAPSPQVSSSDPDVQVRLLMGPVVGFWRLGSFPGLGGS
jgi:hypothetical protein